MILPSRPRLLLLPFLLVLGACAATVPVSGTKASAEAVKARAGQTPPVEDLSSYRPAFPAPKEPALSTAPRSGVNPTNQVNTQVEQRLRDQAYTNQNVKYAQGYRILAYVGLERDKAMAIRREIISRYANDADYLTFKQPVFRLYIGDYLTRLEAEQALLRIRLLAPKAELESTQVLLNKATF